MTKIVVIVASLMQITCCFSQGLKFDGVAKGTSLKRDSEYRMYWEGDLSASIVSVQFRRNNLIVHEVPGFLKAGKYQVKLPAGMQLGNFTLVVLDPSSSAVIQSDLVVVRRRIPMVARVVVVFIAVSALLVIPA